MLLLLPLLLIDWRCDLRREVIRDGMDLPRLVLPLLTVATWWYPPGLLWLSFSGCVVILLLSWGCDCWWCWCCCLDLFRPSMENNLLPIPPLGCCCWSALYSAEVRRVEERPLRDGAFGMECCCACRPILSPPPWPWVWLAVLELLRDSFIANDELLSGPRDDERFVDWERCRDFSRNGIVIALLCIGRRCSVCLSILLLLLVDQDITVHVWTCRLEFQKNANQKSEVCVDEWCVLVLVHTVSVSLCQTFIQLEIYTYAMHANMPTFCQTF